MLLSDQPPGFYACWVFPTSKGFFINHVVSSERVICIYDWLQGPVTYTLSSNCLRQSYHSIIPISSIDSSIFNPSNYPELFI